MAARLGHPRKSLQVVAQSPLTAELLRALVLAGQRLAEANTLLEQSLAAHNTCRALSVSSSELKRRLDDTPASAWLDDLDQLASRWLVAIDALLESHLEAPAAVAEYRRRWLSLEQPDAPLPALRRARSEHQQHWQALSARCP
ncbi:hypothetical protein [Halomonas sp. E19]|uniref:hypothetical protein n=1 Tax=Halomonas sp. E19 TaxID=3397247 RepID=UPI004033FAF4